MIKKFIDIKSRKLGAALQRNGIDRRLRSLYLWKGFLTQNKRCFSNETQQTRCCFELRFASPNFHRKLKFFQVL
ncbi:MAG: hypothetical protein RMY28_021650 [Nostoc sp. ChiSLP01]|nr:hypothetical protein [Nostoc sp. CmiSLP01]MDZ8282718.1 hypothetical protein [Nostoc sp. ChiSLP01]